MWGKREEFLRSIKSCEKEIQSVIQLLIAQHHLNYLRNILETVKYCASPSLKYIFLYKSNEVKKKN